MALKGSFSNYPVGQFGLYCEWTGTQSASGNYTDITMNVYVRLWDLYVIARPATISINGVSEDYTAQAFSDSGNTWHNVLIKTKTVRVKHNADGTKNNVSLSASWSFNGTYSGTSVGTVTASTTVNLDPITVYKLTKSSGTGYSITVNRTSSGYASTGNISDGATLYYGDKLKITFTPSTNYAIATHTVNKSTFTSGNTHTVSGNVSVEATAQVLASSVGATDANIGSTSTITITKYNTSYYHSLQYSFGSLSGYINSAGGISTTEVKFSNASVPFNIPTSFYTQIPNTKTGRCTITCRTYRSSTDSSILGSATTATITITAASSNCTPDVSGTVVDINETTIALTGDDSKLVRYKSTALCTISAIAKNSATISSTHINNVSTTDIREFTNVSVTSFSFSATDSRGYSASVTRNPDMVMYVQLTCIPVITRPTPTGGSIEMSCSGNVYRGSFGAYDNTLTLQYRYRESTDPVFSDWKTVEPTDITYGTSSYFSNKPISLGDDFDYQKSYVFEVRATDGTEDIPLSEVIQTKTVQRGVPVFDWGENDFNINVPLRLNNKDIFDILYPIGSIYMYNSPNSLPDTISKIGAWTFSMNLGGGVYAWKRTG